MTNHTICAGMATAGDHRPGMIPPAPIAISSCHSPPHPVTILGGDVLLLLDFVALTLYARRGDGGRKKISMGWGFCVWWWGWLTGIIIKTPEQKSYNLLYLLYNMCFFFLENKIKK